MDLVHYWTGPDIFSTNVEILFSDKGVKEAPKHSET